jgi:hypothetical protein
LHRGDEARVLIFGLNVADERPALSLSLVDLAGLRLTDMGHELLDSAGRVELDANAIALVSPTLVRLA